MPEGNTAFCSSSNTNGNHKQMRVKKIDVKIERYEDSTEFYKLIIFTHNEKMEAKVDKENLRHLIEKIDNKIV